MALAFGAFSIDVDTYELRRHGEPVHLERQVFAVLAHLVEHRDRVVPKTELLDTVWGDRFVSESALTSRIKSARKAVGDTGRDQAVIRTVHGRGYQFVAPVEETRRGRSGLLEGAPADTATGAGAATTLLERDDVSAFLDEALGATTDGDGRVVVLAGEPGIGKTSVVRAFAQRARGAGARILLGACDDLVTPRPLGPLYDVATSSGRELADALASGDPVAVQQAFLAELAGRGGPTVLVVEDLHWADDATLDLLTVVCRRLRGLPVLVVLTRRSTEPEDASRLDRFLGGLPPDRSRSVDLEPLSEAAVASVVGTQMAPAVMAATGGNPFFVTELAALGGTETVPPLVGLAVTARVARQSRSTRELLDLLAVVPGQAETGLLDQVRPGWASEAEPAERAGLVVVRPGAVAFRHELARRAVLDSMSLIGARRHHGAVLAVLVARGDDPARQVHHADAVDDLDVLARIALPCARSAVAVGSHREAHALYRRVLRVLQLLPAEDHAVILEEASRAAYAANAAELALAEATAALRLHESRRDVVAAGRILRWRSRVHWYLGRRREADADAERAVEVLEPCGDSPELAWAYSNRSQLAMLAWQPEEAARLGMKAVRLAERVGDDGARAHALVNLASVTGDEDHFEDAFAAADAHGEHHEATRALSNRAFDLGLANRLTEASGVAERVLAYAEKHEVHSMALYIRTTIARVDMLRGEWEAAEAELRHVLASGEHVPSLYATIVLAQLQVRRGDPEAGETLVEAWRRTEDVDEAQRLCPLAAAEAEHRWLRGTLDATSPRLRSCYETVATQRPEVAGDLARWLQRVDPGVVAVDALVEPYRSELCGDWTTAAAGWLARGMPYERALALSTGDEAARAEARAIAGTLGARPLLDRLDSPMHA